jgi:hypothetical protein
MVDKDTERREGRKETYIARRGDTAGEREKERESNGEISR